MARSPKEAQPPSYEACRRMTVCTRQQTGNCTRPASREAFRRAAVSPQPTFMSLEQPCAPMGAQFGVKGHCPLRRAAVTPQPSCMSLERPCAPMGAQSGVKGHCPLRGGSPPASEVGGTDAFAGKEGLAAAAQNDPARFHDETVVRRTERRVGVLLNEQDRDAAGP